MSVSTNSNVHWFLSQLVPLHHDEVVPVLFGFSSLFCLLASYFIVLPLREDAAIQLGTSALPKLFVLSLFLALMVAPLVSSYLNRQSARDRDKALRRLYMGLAAVQFGFYLVYTQSEVEGLPLSLAAWQPLMGGRLLGQAAPGAANASAGVGVQGTAAVRAAWERPAAAVAAAAGLAADASAASGGADGGGGGAGGAAALEVLAGQARAGEQVLRQRRRRRLYQEAADAAAGGGGNASDPGGAAAAAGGEPAAAGAPRAAAAAAAGAAPRARHPPPPPLTAGQAALRGVFYAWVSTYNLVAISSLWARCADVFADTGTRLFGFISAGATLGQLCGSVSALALASRGRRAAAAAAAAAGGAPAPAPVLAPGSSRLVLLSAALLFVASQIAPRIRPPPESPAGGPPSPPRAPAPAPPPGAARPAPQVRRRMSGSGGAAGAVCAAGGGGGEETSAAPRATRVLSPAGSAVALTVVGAAAASAGGKPPDASRRSSVTAAGSFAGGAPGGGGGTGSITSGGGGGGGGGGGPGAAGAAADDGVEPMRSHWSELLAGFKLIWGSEYLLLVCAYLLMTYVVGSLMYFERALVVSKSLQAPGERTTFFAWLNSWSATLIALCQLFATAGVLRALGVPLALASGPGVCLAGLALIAIRPLPSTVAGVEVVRKVIGYALIRPAREVLFTVVSRSEKYSAKLVIDMVVQRMGDSIAAGAFQLLDVQLRLGVGGVAVAGCAACAAWLLASLRLGRVHAALAAARARREGGRRHKQEV